MMDDLVISSKQNNLIKYVRGLRDKKNREKEGCYVLEGIKSVREAVTAGFLPQKLVISERGERQSLLKDVLSYLGDTVQIYRVTDEVMDYMSETDTPQGVIAILALPEEDLSKLLISESSLFVVLDGVQDPGNVGTIIRTADAFGIRAVIMTRGCADFYNSKTLRSSMGSAFHIPVVRDVDTAHLMAYFKEHRVFVAATTLAENSVALPDIKFPRPAALVFGSESRGVSPEIIANSDVLVKIPILGSAESLNVAIASGIVLYEASGRLGSRANQTCK